MTYYQVTDARGKHVITTGNVREARRLIEGRKGWSFRYLAASQAELDGAVSEETHVKAEQAALEYGGIERVFTAIVRDNVTGSSMAMAVLARSRGEARSRAVAQWDQVDGSQSVTDILDGVPS